MQPVLVGLIYFLLRTSRLLFSFFFFERKVKVLTFEKGEKNVPGKRSSETISLIQLRC